tara:strand:- start:79 stop:3114 length:3036 start_codon:yes stop_codon:yes gene_type:complete
MSVIRVLTNSGVKNVRINGEEATPEEIEQIKAHYKIQQSFEDMGGTQTAPMSVSAPPSKPQPRQIPELKPATFTERDRAQAREMVKQEEMAMQGPGTGTVATKLVRPRFSGDKPTQGEVAAGKGLGRAVAGTIAVASAAAGDEERAKQIDKNLANIPYEEGATGVAEGIVQYLSVASPAKALAKIRGIEGPIKREVIASGAAGALAFSGEQERLSDLVQSVPSLANPVTDFLASNPDDSFAVGRLKSALDFAGLDAAIMLPFIKNLRQTRANSNLSKKGGSAKLAQEIDKKVSKQGNKPIDIQKGGQAHAGTIQLPDKVVEAVTKPVELALKGGNVAMQKSGVLSDQAIRPLKARVEDLSKRMSHKLDEFEVNQNMLAGKYMHRAVPFLKSFNKMKNVDKQKFTRHALNSEMPEAYDVLRRYNQKLPGIKREFDELRDVFEDLHKLGVKNGLDIPYRKDYLPRILKDYEGFRKAIGKDLKDPIDEAIDVAFRNKNKLGPGQPLPQNPKQLTKFEEREVIRKFLEGQKYTGDSTPGFMKNRVIDKIQEDHLKFYGSFGENVQNYINNLTYRVAKNQFTGKVKGVEGYTELLSRLTQRGDIPKKDAREISRLIGVRLDGGEQSMRAGMQMFRDSVYLSSIANPISTLTQASEFMLNAYRYGTFDTLATAKQTAKRTGLKMSDIGIDDVAREFSDPLSQSQVGNIGKAQKGINIFLRKALGAVQFKRMDELMKESNLNTALRVARKKVANKQSKEYQQFASEMAEYYGPETTNFLDALRRGDVNDGNVKTYLYSQLAKTQPIGLSEYPEIYLKYPSMRPFYFLKSFGLKQLETTRRDVLRKLASGNADEIREGMKQGLRLSLLFGGAMTTNNLFKDYLLDRDDKPGMTGDQMPTRKNVKEAGADAMLTLFGLSRFITRKAYDDPEGAIVDLFLPPKLIDSIESGVSALKGDFDKPARFIEKSIPIGGKIYSEHFGSAADYKRKKRIQEYKAKKRRMEKALEIPSIPNIPDLDFE